MPKKYTAAEAVSMADKAIDYRPMSWRKGQAWYNKLYDIRPDLASRLDRAGLDPYYNTGMLAAARQAVLAMEEPEQPQKDTDHD